MTDVGSALKHPVVTVTAGAAATVLGGAAGAYRACEQLPGVGRWLRRGRSSLAERGEQVIARSVDPARELVAGLGAELVELVLNRVDLNTLVRERVDLVGLSNEVIDGVDLPAIIKESTGSVTAEVMTDVRSQGERADDLVTGFVDRVLGRSQESR